MHGKDGYSIYGHNMHANQGKDGYSFYGQNMRSNPPNKNPYPNNNYPRQFSNPQNQNNIQNLRQNPNNFNNNVNQGDIIINKKVNKNKKYSDLKLHTYFRNDNNPGLSANDLELKNDLETITNQYMIIFNNINDLSSNSAKKSDDIDYKKLNGIKNELNQMDHFNGNEYSNFIGQLYEISKDDNVLNLGYDSYKKNPKATDEEIKKIIENFKYDIVLYKNKNNVTKEDYQRLSDYINTKRQKSKKNEFNIIQSVKNNDNSNNNGFNFSKIYQSSDYNQNNNLIYDDEPNVPNEEGFNLIKDTTYQPNNQKNPKFDDPNDISDYNNSNNNYNSIYDKIFESSKKPSEPIKVKFIIDGKELSHEVKTDDSGEVLQLFAMQEKDEPIIYTQDGNCLTYDTLLSHTIGEIFENCPPILNVY